MYRTLVTRGVLLPLQRPLPLPCRTTAPQPTHNRHHAEEDGRLRYSPTSYSLPGVTIGLIHDIAVTADYYVVTVGPIDFSLAKFATQYLTSRCSIPECLEYRPDLKPTRVHLVPRPSGAAGEGAGYVSWTRQGRALQRIIGVGSSSGAGMRACSGGAAAERAGGRAYASSAVGWYINC